MFLLILLNIWFDTYELNDKYETLYKIYINKVFYIENLIR